MKYKIAIRIEGGFGDCILSTRFVPAIKEYHKDTDNNIICCYDNDRDESYQIDVLKYFYKSFYDEYVLLNRSISGLESLPIINHSDLSQYDAYYNLKIDDMQWATYNFDWLSRFYYFPKPDIHLDKEDYICVHLTHNKWPPKNLSKEYITSVIEKLYDIHPRIVAIASQSELSSYDNVKSKIQIVHGDIVDICKTVGRSRVFLTIDSGFKYIAYSYGVPTLEVADYYFEPGITHPMIHARWLIYPSRGLPLYTDPEIIKIGIKNILDNKIATLYPYQNSNHTTFKLN